MKIIKLKPILLAGIALSFSAATEGAESSVKPSVHVLSWWGYLNKKNPEILAIEKKCHTTLAVDEYYSTNEFLERADEHTKGLRKYDALIYSDTAYLATETDFIKKLKTKIVLKPEVYSKEINKLFVNRNYNSSTSIFQISLSGFLVNKNLLSLPKNEGLRDYFKKTGDNIFVLMDDHIEIATLFKNWQCNELKSACQKGGSALFPAEKKLKELVGSAKVVISSDLAEITKHPKFALAYTWSGDAILRQSMQNNLEFLLHPSLSHTSMDLLSLVGNSPEAQCVANELSSKDFLDAVAARTKYFSPYGPMPTQDPVFAKVQEDFFKHFSTLGRIHRVTRKESLEIDKKWQMFKNVFGKKI